MEFLKWQLFQEFFICDSLSSLTLDSKRVSGNREPLIGPIENRLPWEAETWDSLSSRTDWSTKTISKTAKVTQRKTVLTKKKKKENRCPANCPQSAGNYCITTTVSPRRRTVTVWGRGYILHQGGTSLAGYLCVKCHAISKWSLESNLG